MNKGETRALPHGKVSLELAARCLPELNGILSVLIVKSRKGRRHAEM